MINVQNEVLLRIFAFSCVALKFSCNNTAAVYFMGSLHLVHILNSCLPFRSHVLPPTREQSTLKSDSCQSNFTSVRVTQNITTINADEGNIGLYNLLNTAFIHS